LSEEEFKKSYCNLKDQKLISKYDESDDGRDITLPDNVNWVKGGLLLMQG